MSTRRRRGGGDLQGGGDKVGVVPLQSKSLGVVRVAQSSPGNQKSSLEIVKP